MLRRRRIQLTIVGLLLLLGWLASSALVTWHWTRRSRAQAAEPLPPELAGHVTELRLKTSDGEELGAWLWELDPPRACVVLLHGNGGRRSRCLRQMEWLAESRLASMAISFRAHGDSTGDVNDFGFSARRDVVAAVEWLQHHYPRRPLFVVGRSLGAAAALFAAGELGDRVRGYVLLQPYRDLESATLNRLRSELPTPLDFVALHGMRLWAPLFLGEQPGKISPSLAAAHVPASVPVVFLGSTEDRRVTPDDLRAVQSALAGPSELVLLPGATHGEFPRSQAQEYERILLATFDRWLEVDPIHKAETGSR